MSVVLPIAEGFPLSGRKLNVYVVILSLHFYTLLLSVLLGGLSRTRCGTSYIIISQPGTRMLLGLLFGISLHDWSVLTAFITFSASIMHF